jgi:hypothetical protein
MEFLVHLPNLSYLYFKKKICYNIAFKKLDYNDNTSIRLHFWGI